MGFRFFRTIKLFHGVRLQGTRWRFLVADLAPVTVTQECCRIVSMLVFYPDRLIGQDYIDRFTAVAERRLAVSGARFSGVLTAVLKWPTQN
jgi:hypothetical protein